MRVDAVSGRATSLTRRERDHLVEQLRIQFGADLEWRNGQMSSDYAVAAATLRKFLLDPGWKLQSATPR